MNINNVAFERSFGISSQLPPSSLPEIAFAGRSNVGKSSLLNKLFNRKSLAKVSQTPRQDRHHQLLLLRRRALRRPARIRLRQGIEGGKGAVGQNSSRGTSTRSATWP